MAGSEQDYSVLELQARWDKIRIANLYDTLDAMGYSNQCLDLRIRPLFSRQHLAGKAVTVKGGRDPRSKEDLQAEGKDTDTLVAIREHLFPGAVVVVEWAERLSFTPPGTLCLELVRRGEGRREIRSTPVPLPVPAPSGSRPSGAGTS